MKNYNDKEINRLLAEADELLSDIQLYETPEEERIRKQKEEQKRQADIKRQEELRRQEELQQQEERKRQEELRRQEERKQQEELQQQEMLKQQEEQQRQAGIKQQEELQQQEELNRQERQKQGCMVQQNKQLPVFGVLFLSLSFTFMELVIQLSLYRSVNTTFLYPVLFAAGMGCVTAIVVSFFNKRINTILAILILLLYGCYCDLQTLYHAAFGSFLRLADIWDGAWMLIHNKDITLSAAETVLPWLVLMVLPIILWAVLGRKVICFEKGNWLNRLIIAFAGIICVILSILLLDIHGYEISSPYVCFYHFDSLSNLEASGQQLGMLGTLILEWLEWF